MALVEAAKLNDLGVVEELLAAKADPYQRNEVFLFLSFSGQLTVIKPFTEARNCFFLDV